MEFGGQNDIRIGFFPSTLVCLVRVIKPLFHTDILFIYLLCIALSSDIVRDSANNRPINEQKFKIYIILLGKTFPDSYLAVLSISLPSFSISGLQTFSSAGVPRFRKNFYGSFLFAEKFGRHCCINFAVEIIL